MEATLVVVVVITSAQAVLKRFLACYLPEFEALLVGKAPGEVWPQHLEATFVALASAQVV